MTPLQMRAVLAVRHARDVVFWRGLAGILPKGHPVRRRYLRLARQAEAHVLRHARVLAPPSAPRTTPPVPIFPK